MAEQILYAGVTLEQFTDMVADKISQKMRSTADVEKPSQPSQEDILFKSLQEAADYYGVCYQTISKELDKITHMPFGRSIKVYKSAIEEAIRKYGILSKKGGKK